MFRRRRRRAAHPARETFEPALARVERAKESLVTAIPSPRGVPPRPLAEALLDFERGLRAAAEEMAGWRRPDTELAWARCERALRETMDSAERLRLEAPPLDYESLVAVLAELMAPLEAFEDAERSLR